MAHAGGFVSHRLARDRTVAPPLGRRAPRRCQRLPRPARGVRRAAVGAGRARRLRMTARLAIVVAGVFAIVAAALAGCGTDGTTLRDPKPGATAPPVVTTGRKGSSEGIGTVAPLMAITSPAFVQR